MASNALVRTAALVASAWLLAASTAHAETPAEKADALFKEGTALVEAKHYTEGCAKLAESFQIEPALGTQYNLAACYELAGRYASAKRAYENATRMARQGGNMAGAAKANERASKMAPLVSRLVVKLPAGIAGARVTVDGEVVPVDGAAASVEVDSGARKVRVEASGRVPFERTVTVAEKETQEVAVELAPVPEIPKPRESHEPAEPPKHEASMPTSKWVGLGLAAVGGVALGIGGVFALGAKSAKDDSGCRDGRYCPDAAASSRLTDAKSEANRATIFVVSGAVLAAGGLTLFVTAPGSSQTALRIAPAIGQNAGGVVVVGGL